jgi:phage baseplate assembly protein W
MTDVPHFDIPFRWGPNGHAVTVEQDSADDVRNCVMTILRTDVGLRDDLPEFGIIQQFLRENGVSPAVILSALRRWEPRAELALEADEIVNMIQNVTVTTAGSTGAQ